MKAVFYTLGCKLNQSESEALASSFKSRGFLIGRTGDTAEVYIVNSCTVTSKAEQKARRMIRKFAGANPESAVIVTGCYAQMDPDEINSLGTNVYTVPMNKKHTIMDLPDALAEAELHGLGVKEALGLFLAESAGIPESSEDRFRMTTGSYLNHSRAFMKIQDGCDNRCSYCRVTLARGDSVSLSSGEVLKRAELLKETGYREIVLTGVNLTNYRDTAKGNYALSDLVLDMIPVVAPVRIRLSSLEPDMISAKLIKAVSDDHIVPHFHLPVQSGSEQVLITAGRNYKPERVVQAVNDLRSVKNDPFMAADIIVGLPGESSADFNKTCDLVQELDFSQLHIFTYSPRPGTPLYKAGNPVPERTAGERASVLKGIALSQYRKYLSRWNGRTVSAVLENAAGTGPDAVWTGLTENYLHVKIQGISEDPVFRRRIAKGELAVSDNGLFIINPEIV